MFKGRIVKIGVLSKREVKYEGEEMRQDIAMKYNRRIYPFYKAIGWDPLFYSAIIFLFLTEIKGIQAAKVLYAESAYAFFV